jgi:hypothetical protein
MFKVKIKKENQCKKIKKDQNESRLTFHIHDLGHETKIIT